MRLRPRYSLLTLLILTALVAGGVKLWYGPHRVVETKDSVFHHEREFTFTRTWDGQKIIHGPVVARVINPETHFRQITIAYYRQGKQLAWEYLLMEAPRLDHWQERGPIARQDNPLTPEEYAEVQQTINREKQEKHPGLKTFEYESLSQAFIE